MFAFSCIAISAGLFSTQQLALSGEISIVVPPALESVEGDSKGPTAGAGSNRNQWLIPAAYFTGLPDTHRLISEFVLRPDADIVSPIQWRFENLEIRMSTTKVEPGGLSTTYAANIGDDEALFYKGPATFTANGAGPLGGPRGFFQVEYESGPTAHFFYDPKQGNLLIDLIATNASSMPQEVFIDEQTTPFNVVVAGPAGESTAIEAVPFAPALQLTFLSVPEPTTGAIGLFGLPLIWWKLMRSRCRDVCS